MKISCINFLLPKIQKNKIQNFEKKENSLISFKSDNKEDTITIMDYDEIKNLKNFAAKNKDNVALKIVRGSFIDSKLIKTQNDLLENKGKWLDITNYSNM